MAISSENANTAVGGAVQAEETIHSPGAPIRREVDLDLEAGIERDPGGFQRLLVPRLASGVRLPGLSLRVHDSDQTDPLMTNMDEVIDGLARRQRLVHTDAGVPLHSTAGHDEWHVHAVEALELER